MFFSVSGALNGMRFMLQKVPFPHRGQLVLADLEPLHGLSLPQQAFEISQY